MHKSHTAKMLVDQLAFILVDLIASVENQEGAIFAQDDFLTLFLSLFLSGAFIAALPIHGGSLRVARNSEFFTVSSVVPRASPIARSFNP